MLPGCLSLFDALVTRSDGRGMKGRGMMEVWKEVRRELDFVMKSVTHLSICLPTVANNSIHEISHAIMGAASFF